MPRAGDKHRLLSTFTRDPFAETVERVATAQGISKAAVVRKALVGYVLPPTPEDKR